MKIQSLFLLSLALVGSAQAAPGYFQCNNAPAVRWGTYYCVNGGYDADGTLTEVSYGTCSGSDAAEESEPMEVVEIGTLRPDASLRASSRDWSEASAYDVTTEEHGQATLYLQGADMKRNSNGKGRLKIKTESGTKNVALSCHYS